MRSVALVPVLVLLVSSGCESTSAPWGGTGAGGTLGANVDASRDRAADDDGANDDGGQDGGFCSSAGRDTGRDIDELITWEQDGVPLRAVLGPFARRLVAPGSDELDLYAADGPAFRLWSTTMLGGTYTCGISDGSVGLTQLWYQDLGPTMETCTISVTFSTDDDGCPRVAGTFEGRLVSSTRGVTLSKGRFDLPLTQLGSEQP